MSSRDEDRAHPAGHPALHPHEPVPPALGQPGEAGGGRQLDPAVHADRVVDARHERQAEPGDAEHAVAEHLVVVHHVEVGRPRPQRAQRPEAEGQRLREGCRPHRADLEHVDPVAVLAQPRRAERIRLAVQVEARQGAQQRPWLKLRVGLAGEDLDLVAKGGDLAGDVPQVDALAAAVRLAPVGQHGDAERAIRGAHAGCASSSAAGCRVCRG